MAIAIPNDWPGRTWAEDTPLGHLETLNSNGDPVRWEVAQWTSTREIASSALPGQVRHKTGLSVGTGSALVKRQPDDFPWKQSLVYELTGQDAQILLAPEGRTEIPTGQFRVAEASGNITTLGVQVDLDEKQIEGRDKTPGVQVDRWLSADQFESSKGDPIWMVAELAEQMGYTSGNQIPGEDGYNPILDVPLQGTLQPAAPRGIEFFAGDPDAVSWGASEGAVGLSTANVTGITVTYAVNTLVPEAFTWTFDISDRWVGFEWNDASTIGRFRVEVFTVEGGSEVDLIISSTGANGVSNANTSVNNLDITRDVDTPNRVQVEVTLTPGSATGYNSASVRVRRRDGFWFGPYVHAMGNELSRINEHDIDMSVFEAGGSSTAILSHYSVLDNSVNDAAVRDRLLNATGGREGRLTLEPLYGEVLSPWLDPNLSVWGTMQAIVEAWQGALITDVYGALKVLNRFSLTGVNNLAQEGIIDIGTRFEDLPWVMNYTDQADRLVVKYRPAVLVAAEGTDTSLPTIYEWVDPIQALPGSNDVFFTLEYIYPIDMQLLPFIQKGQTGEKIAHTWDAYRNVDGTGTHMLPGDHVNLRVDPVTSATWKLFIQNVSGSRFFMVDNTGTPYVKLRSSYYYDQTNEVTVERGLSSADAKNALEIDLGHYVQTEEDANTIADFLWGRVNQRSWKATTVNAIPDYTIDLGDVREIVHGRTGVRSNALVTKVDLTGEPGSLTQRIDLLLIPPTWEDFDEVWSGPDASDTWTEFDALWDAYTWNDFDRTPTATTVAEIEAGM